jgi:hypothetical protein
MRARRQRESNAIKVRAQRSKHLLFNSSLTVNPRLLHLRTLLVEHMVALVDPQFLLHQVDMSGEYMLDLVYCLIASPAYPIHTLCFRSYLSCRYQERVSGTKLEEKGDEIHKRGG